MLKKIEDNNNYLINNQMSNETGVYYKNVEFGYTKEDGRYMFKIDESIVNRYQVISSLGKGTFGNVILCEDHKYKKKMALKIIKDIPRFVKAARTEIKILNLLYQNYCEKYNLVSINKHFIYNSHIFIVFDVYYKNLYELSLQRKTDSRIVSYTNQMLEGLSFLDKKNIVHLDLKPENVMVTDESLENIVIIDFGSSIVDNKKSLTYQQSRWYRSPEIITKYDEITTTKSDIWSLGCMIYELYTYNPIFSGKTETEQLDRYIFLLGYPDHTFLNSCLNFSNYNFHPKKMINRCQYKTEFNIDNDNMINFIKQCLYWTPYKRITPNVKINSDWTYEII